MFLFFVCSSAIDDGGEIDNHDMFVTARSAQEARELWEKFQRNCQKENDPEASEADIDHWMEGHMIDYVFLVPPLGEQPGVHLWRPIFESNVPSAQDVTESNDKDLEIRCHAIEIQNQMLAAIRKHRYPQE
jgi:hypothetical protein